MRPQAASSFGELFDLELWSRWFSELDRGFVFLLLLPLVVALFGLWSYYGDKERDEEQE